METLNFYCLQQLVAKLNTLVTVFFYTYLSCAYSEKRIIAITWWLPPGYVSSVVIVRYLMTTQLYLHGLSVGEKNWDHPLLPSWKLKLTL